MLWYVVKVVVLWSRNKARVGLERFIALRVKRSERKANHSFPSSAEGNKIGAIYVALWWEKRELSLQTDRHCLSLSVTVCHQICLTCRI